MAAETNTGTRATVEKVQSIDLVTQFNGSLAKILEVLGVTRKLPLKAGDTIKRYTASATLESGAVDEGDIIPLSAVVLEDATPVTISLSKYRRQATAENIQANGYANAVIECDNKLLRALQAQMRADFFTFLATGTGTATADNLQKAMAQAWAAVQTIFEDDAVDTIVFANPTDVADYLGAAGISVQDIFGMTYLTGFTGIKGMFVSPKVPQGTLYATAASNIALAYIDVSGELAKGFPGLVADETGFIGVLHDTKTDRAAVDTVVMTGATLFAEVLSGVVVIDFGSDVSA